MIKNVTAVMIMMLIFASCNEDNTLKMEEEIRIQEDLRGQISELEEYIEKADDLIDKAQSEIETLTMKNESLESDVKDQLRRKFENEDLIETLRSEITSFETKIKEKDETINNLAEELVGYESDTFDPTQKNDITDIKILDLLMNDDEQIKSYDVVNENKNIYDPYSVEIGDKIDGFEVVSIDLSDGIDIAFEGDFILTGTLVGEAMDSYFMLICENDYVMNQIPFSTTEIDEAMKYGRDRKYFNIINDDDLKVSLGDEYFMFQNSNYTKEVTLVLSHYNYYTKEETGRSSWVLFNEIIDINGQ